MPHPYPHLVDAPTPSSGTDESAERTAPPASSKDREALERQIRDLRRFEVVGRLAAGAAHDLSNHLAVIHLVTQRLLREYSEEEDLRRHLVRILESEERAATRAHRLLAVGRRDVPAAPSPDLRSVLQKLAPLLQRSLPLDVSLELAVGTESHPVVIHPHQLEHLVLGLVLDARDALPAGGRICVSLDDEPPAEAAGSARAWTRMRVIGEPRGDRLEPPGTGFPAASGAITQDIVEAAHGRLRRSELSAQGATAIEVFLPRGEAPVPSPPGLPMDAPADLCCAERAGRVLVVEEDPLLRDALVEELTAAGHRVRGAADGLQALQLFEPDGTSTGDAPGPWVLVSTAVLPGMSGPELAERLRERVPDLRAIYLTSVSRQQTTAALERPGGRELRKPYTARQIRRAVWRALADPQDAGSP